MYDRLFLDDPKSSSQYLRSCDPSVVAQREEYVRAQLRLVEEQLHQSVERRASFRLAGQRNFSSIGHNELVMQRDELLRILGPPTLEQTTQYLIEKLSKFPPLALEAAWTELSSMLGLSGGCVATPTQSKALQARVSLRTAQSIKAAAREAGITVTAECHRRLEQSRLLISEGPVEGLEKPGWADEKRTSTISWREPASHCEAS